jgi:hypothetical protein
MNNRPKQDLSDRLLDDDAFVDLMESEYKAHDGHTNDIKKQQVWRRLVEQIEQSETEQSERRKTNRSKPNWRGKVAMSLATVALLIIVVIPLLPTTEFERNKGPATALELKVFSMKSDGQLQPSPGHHAVGSTIVFKFKTQHKQYTALLLARNEGSPSMRFSKQVTPYADYQLLQKENHAYGYMPDPEDKTLRFCLIGADSKTGLNKILENIESEWVTLPTDSCARLVVTNS